MQPRHILLAVLLTVAWGVNFVFIAIGLTDFPPLLLAALRFILTAIPVLFLPRPNVPWPVMVAAALTLFVGQFSLMFSSMTVGMPAGLASIVAQSQAFVTIAIAAAVLHEYPTKRQIAGGITALAGLMTVGVTTGTSGLTLAGLLLLLAAAVSWAIGNVMLRRAGKVDMLAMISWLALIAAGPQLLLSLMLEGPDRIIPAFTNATWLTIGALAYIAFVSTTFSYAAWGHLLKNYPAATVAPFSLLVPVSGTVAAYLILGEQFGTLRLAGMALILAGLAVLILGPRRPGTASPATPPVDPG